MYVSLIREHDPAMFLVSPAQPARRAGHYPSVRAGAFLFFSLSFESWNFPCDDSLLHFACTRGDGMFALISFLTFIFFNLGLVIFTSFCLDNNGIALHSPLNEFVFSPEFCT